MSPDEYERAEQEMGERIIDAAEWDVVVLIDAVGAAQVRGGPCPLYLAQTLRLLADEVEHSHPDHQCGTPRRTGGDGR